MMLDFGEAVRQFYGSYVNADGRAQRSAYWWPQLYQLIIYAVLVVVFLMAEGTTDIIDAVVSAEEANEEFVFTDDMTIGPSGIIAMILFFCFAIANFLPNIMLNIRRFHDLGQTGWLVLVFQGLGLIQPIGFVAGLVNLIWFMIPGTAGPNQYGPDPLERNSDIFG